MNFEVVAIAGLVSGVIAVAQIIWLAHARRTIVQQTQHSAERLAQCERLLTAARAQELGLGQRVVELERRLAELEDTTADAARAGNAQYGQALALLQRGADPAVVAAASGLSHCETELMALIRGRRTQ